MKERLEQAALALFAQEGYEAATAARIAAQAGVPDRPFFRHFTDKSDILFLAEPDYRALLAEELASIPAHLTGFDLVLHVFTRFARHLDARRDVLRRRDRILAAVPRLRERERTKLSTWTQMIAEALEARGMTPREAALASQVGMTVFHVTSMEWLHDEVPSAKLGTLLKDAFRACSKGFAV